MAHININGKDIFVNMKGDKEQFINEAEQKAKNYEALSKFYALVFKPTVQEFHGKPLNNRFVLALQQRALDVDENIIIGSTNRYDDGTSYMNVSTSYVENSYNSSINLSIEEKFAGSDKRLINSAATLHRNLPWRKDMTKEEELLAMAEDCRESARQYDECLRRTAELHETIEQWRNSVPANFRYAIEQYYLQA